MTVHLAASATLDVCHLSFHLSFIIRAFVTALFMVERATGGRGQI